MSAISFQPEFLNALLSCEKQQTTRPVPPVPPKHPRFNVGDVLHVYNQQRRRIVDKPLLRLTADGVRVMTQKTADGTYPYPPTWHTNRSYAHFLGKVEITNAFNIHPCEMPLDVLTDWAHDDGFTDLEAADTWFTQQHGGDWDTRYWAVVRWDGWLERYFEPEVL